MCQLKVITVGNEDGPLSTGMEDDTGSLEKQVNEWLAEQKVEVISASVVPDKFQRPQAFIFYKTGPTS
ncbi:MAG: hypothetical protein WC813_04240 [Patescibacteria group bacterium]|jgi:molybdopterin biosynthesis enzyme MoaB